MSEAELKAEHKHIYETRLGILGLGATDTPSAAQHNLAVIEADRVIAKLRKEQGVVARLKQFAESL